MNKHVKLAFVLLSLLPCLSLSAYALKGTDSSVSASYYTLNGVGGSYVYTPENLQNAPNLGTHAVAASHQAPAQPAVAEPPVSAEPPAFAEPPAVAEAPATTPRLRVAASQERQAPTPVAQARRKFRVVDQTVRLSAAPESALTAATAPTAGATQPAGSRAAALSRNAQASAVFAARPAAPAAAKPARATGAAGAASAGTARLNGIKLLAAPYLRDSAHAALTQGAQERLAALGGREVTAALLQRALSDVTRYYRAQGFTGAQAYFPVQTAHDGVISMVVAAPVLNTVSVENNSGVRSSYLDYLLGGVKERSGTPIEHEALNNQLLKLTDLGVFSLQGQFSANDVHGLSHDLELLAQPQRDPVERRH